MLWFIIFVLVGCLCVLSFQLGVRMPGRLVSRESRQEQSVENTLGGLSDLEAQVVRLIQFTSEYSGLSIADQDHRRRLTIDRSGNCLRFEFRFHTEWEAAEEVRVRALFLEEGISPSEDYIWWRDKRHASTRHLTYSFPKDASLIARISARVLKEILGFGADDSLVFMLWENRISSYPK